MHPEGIGMRTLIMCFAAIAAIFGGSVWAVGYEIPLPKPEPVSFVQRVEGNCPDQRLKPGWNYNSPCVQRTIMSFFEFD